MSRATPTRAVAPLTPPEHQHSAVVECAAMWLSEQNPTPRPIIPELRRRFDLSAIEAIEAAALAQRYRVLRGAFA
ncbi:hypothetical protein EV184_118110 [Sinorhizobium americanum]|uniref:Uncharacterized protein n=1 Tax=Sinorhizobium americanum TaxID=194963 RepID=A0A4R2BGC2_9HYPH|nr:hypothetical protein EV184_118110 [Sinorhizobium americanum]